MVLWRELAFVAVLNSQRDEIVQHIKGKSSWRWDVFRFKSQLVPIGQNLLLDHCCVLLDTTGAVVKTCGPKDENKVVFCIAFRTKQ